jgi:hypothetical protein
MLPVVVEYFFDSAIYANRFCTLGFGVHFTELEFLFSLS